jgi:hypothetical protein
VDLTEFVFVVRVEDFSEVDLQIVEVGFDEAFFQVAEFEVDELFLEVVVPDLVE